MQEQIDTITYSYQERFQIGTIENLANCDLDSFKDYLFSFHYFTYDFCTLAFLPLMGSAN